MSNLEEYVINKESNDTESSIFIDGKYYNSLKNKMLGKFSKQKDPEKRVAKLEENALEIYKKIQYVEKLNNREDRNILLVGKVQSGKTSNMQMGLALAFDNGYDVCVVYGGYDNTLVDQAVKRFGDEAFKKPDNMSEDDALTEWVNIFTINPGKFHGLNELDDDNLHEIISDGGKILIICIKKPSAIDKVTEKLSKLDLNGIKSIIFDDEGDQASLNNEFRKDSVSATYNSIVNMKILLKNPPYVSVTATPQALVFSPETSRLKPQCLQLIHPGNGYTGLNEFHFKQGLVVYVKDEINDFLELNKPRLPDSLMIAIKQFIVSSAIIVHKKILKKTQMIIHFDNKISKHETIYNLITSFISSVQENIKFNQINTVNRKIESLREIYENDDLISPEVKNDITFEDIHDSLLKVLKEVYPALMNSKGKETMGPIAWKKFQIRIGADLLQRGVSFDELITTYFTRWPKGYSNMDTQIQRARWLGYRSKYFDYCKIFTTSDIYQSFSNLADNEFDLWDQMEDVENGEIRLDDIIVEADPKMRPSRRSAADYSVKMFGMRWLKQQIGLHDTLTINHNNLIVEDIISRHEFLPVHEGSTDLDPDRITAYQTYIDFVELEELISKTDDIFYNHPFDDINKILKMAIDKRINLEIFWNPDEVDFNDEDRGRAFRDYLRTRSFREHDGHFYVSALHQGADKVADEEKKYLGDASVISDREAVTIQVFPMLPIASKSPEEMAGKFQYMFAIHSPKSMAVYSKGD